MLIKSGLFLFLLAILQVSARYEGVESDINENEINLETAPLSSSSRIISGSLATRGQFPYHASLRFVTYYGNVRQCGGAIAARLWIITSASCTVDRFRVVVHAGGVSFTNSEYFAQTTEWYVHPHYDRWGPEPRPYDISLVKLQQALVYTGMIQPIRIQSWADGYLNYDGQLVVATGHGSTHTSGPTSDVLRWVNLRAISNNECARIYSNAVYSETICAQFFNLASQATCSGDDGGPLVHTGANGIPTLVGISVLFESACKSSMPSGFIRPGPFIPWIQQVTGLPL